MLTPLLFSIYMDIICHDRRCWLVIRVKVVAIGDTSTTPTRMAGLSLPYTTSTRRGIHRSVMFSVEEKCTKVLAFEDVSGVMFRLVEAVV